MSLPSFAWYGGLCFAQGAIVLLPGPVRSPWLAALRARWPLITIPAVALTAATFLPGVASRLAVDLSTLALLVVPPLAALGLGWAMRWHDRRLPLIALVPLAVAWNFPRSPLGEAGALIVVALSCVALSAVVVAVLPRAVAKLGIALWAAGDLALALAHRLEQASRAITEAAPAVAPPLRHLDLQQLQLQRVVLGTASMEYADLFVAATLGAVLAAQSRRAEPAALMVAAVALSLSAFFLVTNVIPATVPVAAGLAFEELRTRRSPDLPHGELGTRLPARARALGAAVSAAGRTGRRYRPRRARLR